MARKNVLKYEVAAGQVLAADFSSDPTIVQYHDNVSYQINVRTSDDQGSFVVQASNDYSVDSVTGSVINAGNWVDLSGTTLSINAANDTLMINLNQVSFYAVRIHYASSVSGTGDCDIWIDARQIGG